MYEGMCSGCGGSVPDGEGYCDECLADRNGGFCISLGGCSNKAVPGEGFCEEHLNLLRDSYAELYNQFYCKHGVERDTDGCWQCEQEMEYCDRCMGHYSECACYYWEDGKTAVRPVEQSKLILEMGRREANWNWNLYHAPQVRAWKDNLVSYGDLDDIPF